MDFLDPKKKRAHLIRLYIGYALVAIAIGIGSLILLYSSYGYGVDRHTGKVIQNGLVFVSSQPGDASIELKERNGKKEPPAQTNTRMTIPEGQYSIKLTKNGYRDWSRNFTLTGGSVERLMYPLLFPQDLITTDTELYASQPPLLTQSPDRHWILAQKPGSSNEFDVFDANQSDPSPKVVAIPTGVLSSGPNQTLKVIEWSTNNKHVLLRHSYGDAYEFILFNHDNPSESINLNKHLGLNPAEVVLYDKQVEQVYLLMGDSGLLQRANIKDRRVTPLIPNVIAFKSHGSDMIQYVSRDTIPVTGKVTVRLRTDSVDYTLRELPANTTYLLDLAKFDNRWYVVVGAQSDNKLYVYQDPLNILRQKNPRINVPARTLRLDNPQKVSFSANARFIAAQSGQYVSVYDAETDRQYRYAVAVKLDPSQPAKWMDGHRLAIAADGRVIVWDFDGNNLQVLNPAIPGTDPLFDREYRAIYTLASSEQVKGRFALTRTSLLLP